MPAALTYVVPPLRGKGLARALKYETGVQLLKDTAAGHPHREIGEELVQPPNHRIDTGGLLILVVRHGEFGLHAVVAVDVGVVEIAPLGKPIQGEARFYSCLGHLLGRDIDRELLQLPIPENVGQGLKFLTFFHIATEERDDLLEQGLGDQGQGRGKPGPHRLKLRNVVFGGDKLAHFGLAHLVHLSCPFSFF